MSSPFTREEQIVERQLQKDWLEVRRLILQMVLHRPDEVTIARAIDSAYDLGVASGKREGVALAREAIKEQVFLEARNRGLF